MWCKSCKVVDLNLDDYVYNIGFAVNGVEDETQFDTSFKDYKHAIIDLMNLFLEFVKENKFDNVKIKYIEKVEIERK